MNQTDHNAQCRKTLLKILNETAGHYTSKNRAVMSASLDMCAYRDDVGNRCAIGRTMKKSAIDRLENNFQVNKTISELVDNNGIHAKDFYSRYHITDEMLADGNFIEMLSLIQNLHDDACSWNTKGLSSKVGKSHVDQIKGEILKNF